MGFIVAIDGPAGSGKGTVTKIIADTLNLINIDTGATYRCVALETINKNVKLEETDKIIKLLDEIKIEFKRENGEFKYLLNDEDVTSRIRQTDVNKIVSQVSSIPEVRYKMVDLQRKIAENKDVIMEGRDIGTYVFPNANVKIYLDASVDVRAKRRYKESLEKGLDVTYEDIYNNIKMRDENDMNKPIGALKKAEDAIYLDTSSLTIDEVSKKLEQIILEEYNKRK